VKERNRRNRKKDVMYPCLWGQKNVEGKKGGRFGASRILKRKREKGRQSRIDERKKKWGGDPERSRNISIKKKGEKIRREARPFWKVKKRDGSLWKGERSWAGRKHQIKREGVRRGGGRKFREHRDTNTRSCE